MITIIILMFLIIFLLVYILKMTYDQTAELFGKIIISKKDKARLSKPGLEFLKLHEEGFCCL